MGRHDASVYHTFLAGNAVLSSVRGFPPSDLTRPPPNGDLKLDPQPVSESNGFHWLSRERGYSRKQKEMGKPRGA